MASHLPRFPLLAPRMVQIGSGLVVPSSARPRRRPQDGIHPYLASWEVMRRPVTWSEFATAIRSVQAADLVVELAELNSKVELRGVLDLDLQSEIARSWIGEPDLTRVLNLIAQGRPLIAPQVLMVAMKAALAMSPPGWSGHSVPPAAIGPVVLFIADLLGQPQHKGTTWLGVPDDIVLDMSRNQHFNRDRSIYAQVASFWRIWVELPAELQQLPNPNNEFTAAAGISLVELMLFGSLLRSLTEFEGTCLVSPQAIAAIPLDAKARDRGLQLLAATEQELRNAVGGAAHSTGALAWGLEALRHRPILQLPDGWLAVLGQRFLADATLGDAAFRQLDTAAAAQDGGRRSRSWQAFRNRHAATVEAYVRETVAGWKRPLSGLRALYTEDDQRSAWGRDVKVCDLLLDFGWAWIGLEVVSRRPTEGAIGSGNLTDLEAELNMAVTNKARQIAAAFELLRLRGEKLTRRDPIPGLALFPVIVAAHGFPANTLTLREARHRTAADLARPGVAPLEVIDLDELDFLDSVFDGGLGSLPELLQDKHRSPFSATSLTEFTRGGLDLNPGISLRIERTFQRAHAAILSVAGIGG